MRIEEVIISQSSSQESSFHNNKEKKERYFLSNRKIQDFNDCLRRLKIFVTKIISYQVNPSDGIYQYNFKYQKSQKQLSYLQIDSSQMQKFSGQRIQRMIKSKRIMKNWRNEDRILLYWIVISLARIKHYQNVQQQFTQQNWKQVASLIPAAKSTQCMFKWLTLYKTNIENANWSCQESHNLKNLVAKYVNQNKSIRWKDICKKLYSMNQNSDKNFRTPRQCKQHWNCKLNPNLKKGPWTQQQDIQLFKAVKQNSGLKKWVQMIKLFDGRTQNAIKNRYNLIIQKQRKYENSQIDELQLVQRYLQKCYIEKNLKLIEPDSQQQRQTQQKQQIKKIKKIKKVKNIQKVKKQQKNHIKIQCQQLIKINYDQNNLLINDQYNFQKKSLIDFKENYQNDIQWDIQMDDYQIKQQYFNFNNKPNDIQLKFLDNQDSFSSYQ